MQILLIALFLIIISFLHAQDCQNPLLNTFALTGLPEPETAENLPYCKSLQNDGTCCSTDTISSFQDQMNNLVNRLNTYASAKDLYLTQLRNKYFDDYDDFIDEVDDYSDELANIREENPQVADQIKNEIDQFRKIYTETRDTNNQFWTLLRDYQDARLECFRIVLEVQSSAWCLACDPNYADKGVSSDGTINFSEGLCKAISDTCYPFLSQTVNFNPLIQARESYWRLKTVWNYLDDYSDGDPVEELSFQEDPYNPLYVQQSVTIPQECNEQGCSWQCKNLFSGNSLNELLLVSGAGIIADPNINEQTQEDQSIGESSTPIEGENLPIVENADATQEGKVWEPDLTAAGLNLNLIKDPGDIFGEREPSDYVGEFTNVVTEAILDQNEDN